MLMYRPRTASRTAPRTAAHTPQVDMCEEQDVFQDLGGQCMSVLVLGLNTRLDAGLQVIRVSSSGLASFEPARRCGAFRRFHGFVQYLLADTVWLHAACELSHTRSMATASMGCQHDEHVMCAGAGTCALGRD